MAGVKRLLFTAIDWTSQVPPFGLAAVCHEDVDIAAV